MITDFFAVFFAASTVLSAAWLLAKAAQIALPPFSNGDRW